MPQISVIVPVYNVEPYLERCMQSLLLQTYRDYEIILVDDGSTDACPAMCDSYAEQYSLVRVIHQKNAGLSAARNAGLLHALGQRIAFVDSDDWVSEDYLKTLSRLMDESNADIAMCGFERVGNENSATGIDANNTPNETYSADEFLEIMLRIRGNRSVHYAWGKLYVRNVLQSDGHFPEGMLNEDVEGTFKALLKSKIIAETSAPLYKYFINPRSITGSAFGENYLNLTDVWRRVLHIAEQERPSLVPYVDYNLKRADFTILCDSIIHGDIASDEAHSEDIEMCRRRLVENLWALLCGPMVFNRKIALLAVSGFYRQILYVARLRQKGKPNRREAS